MILKQINLAMFDGEGGPTGAGAAAPAPTSTGRSMAGTEISASQVLGGAAVQETTAPESKAQPLTREEQFAQMIGKDGEYGDLYRQRVQRAVSDRMARASKAAEAVQPVLDLLHQRYGTDDPAKIAEELGKDNDFWQSAADRAGMDVDDFRNLQQIKAREQRLRQQVEQMTQQRAQEQLEAQWRAQGEEMKAKYPGFDIDREAQNPTFARMITAGASVENAYKALHHDELVQHAIDYAMGRAQKSVADTVRKNGMRPAENGVSSSSAPITIDVASMSREQRNSLFSKQKKSGAKINLF